MTYCKHSNKKYKEALDKKNQQNSEMKKIAEKRKLETKIKELQLKNRKLV